MSCTVQLNGQAVAVSIVSRRPQLNVKVADSHYQVDDKSTHGGRQFEIVLNGSAIRGWRYATADEVQVRINGTTYTVRFPVQTAGSLTDESSDRAIRAEMPGTVVEVHCRCGDIVKTGDKLLTTESMKLQVVHLSPFDAFVEKVNYLKDESFEKNALLLILATDDGSCQ